MNMGLRLTVLASLILIYAPIPAVASCTGHESLSRSIGRENVVAAFSGTVVGVQSTAVGDILTFRVDTVWKGEVSRTMLIYHPNGLPVPPLPSRSSIPPPTTGIVRGQSSGVRVASEFLPFYETRRYVVVAHRMTDYERAAFQLDRDGDYLAVDPCGRRSFDEANARGHLDGVGPGRAPQ